MLLILGTTIEKLEFLKHESRSWYSAKDMSACMINVNNIHPTIKFKSYMNSITLNQVFFFKKIILTWVGLRWDLMVSVIFYRSSTFVPLKMLSQRWSNMKKIKSRWASWRLFIMTLATLESKWSTPHVMPSIKP